MRLTGVLSKLKVGLLLAAIVMIASCSSTTFNATPTLSSISPSHITAGSPAFQLNVVALNLIKTTTVAWNGTPLATTLNTTTNQLAAQVPASLVAIPGSADITVVNPAPGGGSSSGTTFFIFPANNPAPTITALSPTSASAGGAAFTLTVTGTGFASGVSTVNWDGQARATTYVSSTQLTASVTASDIATSGTDSVSVSNSAPGGGNSNSAPFFVDPSGNPTPGISSLNPASTSAGSAAFSLSLMGRGFVSTSVVNWNGTPRATTFTSSTQLSAAILASDIATAGIDNVTVTNPAPGGGTSLAQQFTVNNSVPTITSLAPSNTAAGGPAFSLAVTGSNFVANSAVNWNGSGRQTTFVSSTQLTAAITAADIAVGGTASVTVVNPSPGGGPSSSLTFKITGSQARPALNLNAAAQLVSINAFGSPSNGPSGAPKMDGSGRFIAFQSVATNLVRNGGGGRVFVRDTCLGAASCTPQTLMIDVGRDGSPANGPAGRGLAISGDARFVAFSSRATNLTAGASPDATQIYLRDTCMGPDAPADCALKTTLISISLAGEPASGASEFPSISFDGRYVSFTSVSAGLVSGVAGGGAQIYLRDTCMGVTAPPQCVPHTALVSQDMSGHAGKGASLQSSISSDGRYVAFDSDAVNMASNPMNATSSVLLRDTCRGVSAPENCTPSTRMLSAPGAGATGDGPSFAPAINADGRYVAFVTRATNLIPGLHTTGQQIAIRDTCLGDSAPKGCTPSISMATEGVIGESHSPAINADGSLVSFVADDSAAASADSSAISPTILSYVHATCVGASTGAGCTPHTMLISISTTGKADLLPDRNARFALPISENGAILAIFSVAPPSVASGMIANASGVGDVYLLQFPAEP
jgi:trimeric autotransporter adhesin